MPFEGDLKEYIAAPVLETETQRILREARELVQRPGVWAKGTRAGTCGRACVITAISRVANGVPLSEPAPGQMHPSEMEAVVAFELAAGINRPMENIPDWNDSVRRQLPEVLAAFDSAYVIAGPPQAPAVESDAP